MYLFETARLLISTSNSLEKSFVYFSPNLQILRMHTTLSTNFYSYARVLAGFSLLTLLHILYSRTLFFIICSVTNRLPGTTIYKACINRLAFSKGQNGDSYIIEASVPANYKLKITNAIWDAQWNLIYLIGLLNIFQNNTIQLRNVFEDVLALLCFK